MAFQTENRDNTKSPLPKEKNNPRKEILRADALFISLVKYGFQYFKPASSTWKSTFVMRKGKTVLCILLRKNGIDLRFYEDYKGGIFIKDDRSIAMSGGALFRNHYNESNALINRKIALIASSFAKGKVLDSIQEEDGRSYLLNPKYPNIQAAARERFHEKAERMREDKDWRDICKYVADECGGYWGDGQRSL